MRKLIFLTLLFLRQGLLEAQVYNIARYGVPEGLLHAMVTDIVQDQRGYLWIATGGGVSRFDGLRFYHITARNGLNFPRITCLGVDKQQNLWIGSANGINVYNGDSVFSLINPKIGPAIFDIEPDAKDGVWASTEQGLFRLYFKNNRIVFEKTEYPFINPVLNPIFQVRDQTTFLLHNGKNILYYGLNGSLFRIAEKKIEPVITDTSVYVTSGTILADGSLIVGSNRGLFLLKGSTFEPFLPNLLQRYYITKIIFNSPKLWMLGQQKSSPVQEMFLLSVDLSKPDKLLVIGRNNGLIESPTSLYIDHENNVWTGSNAGISVLKGESFITYTVRDGLVGNKIWSLLKTKNGEFWIGTIGEGLSVWNEKGIKNYTTQNGLPDNFVGKIFEDTDGSLWIGTSNAGIAKVVYNPHTGIHKFVLVPLLPETKKIRIDDFLVDKTNTLWVGSSYGLFYSKNRKNFLSKPFPSTVDNPVFVQKILYDTTTNRIWIATRTQGLFYMVDDSIYRYPHIKPNEQLTTMCVDGIGNLWVGSRMSGIFKIENDSVFQIDAQKGLSSNLIFILHGDSQFNLWVGTNLGLDKIDLSTIDKPSPTIRHYGSTDGMIDLETNLSGVVESNDGYIYFATNGGILRYDPYYDFQNRIPPKLNLLSITLHSHTNLWKNTSEAHEEADPNLSTIRLDYTQNHLTFDFIAISFKNPSDVTYLWKMEGFDNDWVRGSRSQQAIYSSLPPGEYKLRIKAANSDGVISNEVLSPTIIIVPPFWQKTWFRFTLMLLVIALVTGGISYRFKMLKREQIRLESIVAQRTQELSEQLKIVDAKNRQILDSIVYARFLQNALSPSRTELSKIFGDILLVYRPKDVISGDFYWAQCYDDITIVAVADCTGHGVPGAIVSVVCMIALQQAIQSMEKPDSPAKILGKTLENVKSFFIHGDDVSESMDIGLCCIDNTNKKLIFSGANIGLYCFQPTNKALIKPTPLTIRANVSNFHFEEHRFDLSVKSTFFIATDGFYDQFGEKTNTKYSQRRFYNTLAENIHLPLPQLETLLTEEFENWMGTREQIDDVLVLGFTI